MSTEDSEELDDHALQRYYTSIFDERTRIQGRSAQGELEFRRTQELIRDRVPARSRILDVGGATGVHALPLIQAGHQVQLIDPVLHHVEQARAAGVPADIGDARHLEAPDATFDAVLYLGPLYHLRLLSDRLQALREAHRVLRPGGLLFAAGISRFAALGGAVLGRLVPRPLPQAWLDLLQDGDIGSTLTAFPGGHAHTAETLHQELERTGFQDIEVLAVEGATGLALESLDGVADITIEIALDLARRLAHQPGDRDISNHIIGIARTPPGRALLQPLQPNSSGVGGAVVDDSRA